MNRRNIFALTLVWGLIVFTIQARPYSRIVDAYNIGSCRVYVIDIYDDNGTTNPKDDTYITRVYAYSENCNHNKIAKPTDAEIETINSYIALQNKEMKIYPNPIKGDFVTIELDKKDDYRIAVFDMQTFQKVLEKNVHGNKIKLNLAEKKLRSGLYLVKIFSETTIKTGHFLIR